jgi:hypothetical protein
MSKSVDTRVPAARTELYHHFCVSQFQPLSKWIMILGFGERFESLMPADAEWSRRAIFAKEEVFPRGQRSPAVISLPMEIMERGREALAKELEVARV